MQTQIRRHSRIRHLIKVYTVCFQELKRVKNSLGVMMSHSCLSWSFEPSHKIMVLFILCKLILQTHMRSHPVGLDVWFLVIPFIFFYTSCVRTAKALWRLHGRTGSPEPSLVAYVLSTIISWAGSFVGLGWATGYRRFGSGRPITQVQIYYSLPEC